MQNHTIINKFSDRTTAWCQITISIQNANIYCVCARRFYLYIEKEQATKITFCKSIYIFIVWSLSFVSVRIANILFMSLLFCQSFFTLLRNLFATHTPQSLNVSLSVSFVLEWVRLVFWFSSWVKFQVKWYYYLCYLIFKSLPLRVKSCFFFIIVFRFVERTWYFRTRKRERTRERDFIQTQQYTTILFWIFFFFLAHRQIRLCPPNIIINNKYWRGGKEIAHETLGTQKTHQQCF